MTKQELLTDIICAYKDARLHKRNMCYQLEFEYNLEANLHKLCDELWARTYKPRPSTCFIIHDPKMREVFAADFRDRIVHHLFYNYTYKTYERTFIADSYSCIKDRGTHYGIGRLRHHILSESHGYQRECYVLKIDIKGYFMHINRKKLWQLCNRRIHPDSFEVYLLDVILNLDPLDGCIILGNRNDWNSLPDDKSLFKAAPDCGLPIGNLSSQLFSNVYLNEFDQYCKRVLKARHYGRYVDDAYFVSHDRAWLKSIIPQIRQFLLSELGLELNERKLQITNVQHGVEFLGAFVKPYRTYPSTSSWKRMKKKVRIAVADKHLSGKELQAKVNSHLGVMSHYDCYDMRRVFFGYESGLTERGWFDKGILRFYPSEKTDILS